MRKFINTYLIHVALVLSLIATMGSLYFSEIQHMLPCKLCWYQRILMYPLVILYIRALWIKDKKIFYFTFPMTVWGWCIAVYHYGKQKSLYIQELFPDTCGIIPCTTDYINWFGFITIPFLSIIAFTLLNIVHIIYFIYIHKKDA